jgi:hypothetical protein
MLMITVKIYEHVHYGNDKVWLIKMFRHFQTVSTGGGGGLNTYIFKTEFTEMNQMANTKKKHRADEKINDFRLFAECL